MAVNVVIDDKLLTSAFNISRLKTKRETVNLALEEFIQRRNRIEAIDMFGKIEFNKDWNPRKARNKI